MNLKQEILGVTFHNPTVLASGIWGITSSGWKEVARNGAGAVTTKSLWPEEHKGNPNPIIISTEHWMLNAVGVPDAGPVKAKEEIGEYMKEHPVPLIANIIGLNADQFASIAREIAPLKPDLFEVNLSTPTFLSLRGKLFAEDEKEVQEILDSVKNEIGNTPMLVKLTPNVPNIGEIALAAVKAGADGITAINTVGPGMAIDLKSRMPILAAHKGGLSGRGIKPIAVRCIAEIYESLEGRVPIIGTGGVFTGEDAIELLLAGASLIGIGSAVSYRGASVFRTVCEEIESWCEAEGVKELSELTGGMHRELHRRGITKTAMRHS
jgi:dihydroorotate dehydrogenase (NAD+) catalytic subunit